MQKKPGRFRRILRFLLVGMFLFVLLGVWITHQFPGLIASPKSSLELLRDLFTAPVRMVKDPAKFVFKRVAREGMVLFIRSSDLEDDVEDRLVGTLRGDQFKDETVPFLFYLYSLYGSQLDADGDVLAELGYDEPPAEEEPAATAPNISALLRTSSAVRQHVRTALRLYDALFLRKALAGGRLEGKALEDVKKLFAEVADDMLSESDDALSEDVDENDYLVLINEIFDDDERLQAFVECFTDAIRGLSKSWLDSFVQREQRKDRRLQWVEECFEGNRYHEIADYAAARARRKMIFHLAVDGLQGKLLEGLAQLSMGDRAGSGARYVTELVEKHRSDIMDPKRYESNLPNELPPGLGKVVQELADQAPKRPEYLKNFKKYFFSKNARAVTVNVATSDTPSISVRNLPIIFSGHKVAGPFGMGIPNFSYLDRRTGRGWYFWGSDALYMRKIFGNREDEIPGGVKRPQGPGAQTLFERLWRYNTVSCMASIDMGALEKISSEIGMAVGEMKRNFIEKAIVIRFRQRAEMERELNKRRRWLMEHRDLSDSFLGALLTKSADLMTFHDNARFLAEHEDEGLPDYVLWYNPWPDHFAHLEGPYSDPIIGYRGEYDRLDFYLGKMIEIYESVTTVDGTGSYADRTLFGVVSDHGLIYTPRLVSLDEELFEAMRRDGIDIKMQKLSMDEGGMPVILGRKGLTDTRPFDVVVGSTAGGSYVIDLFDSDSLEGIEDSWWRHPGFHELRSQKLGSGKTETDWIVELRKRLKGIMDVALVREYVSAPGKTWPPDVESVVRVFTPDRGDARIYRIRSGKELRYRYQVLGSEDPLDLIGSIRDYLLPPGATIEETREALTRCLNSTEGRPDHEWSELLSRTLRPDVIYQFSHLYDTDRAGTINVFPLPHVGMNSGVPGRHAGESFGERNTTQLYFGAGLKKATIQTARNGSLPVTLYHWFVGDKVFRSRDPLLEDMEVSPADQFGFSSLLDDPSFEPILDGR